MKTKVVNLKHEDYDVYIGRGSEWGNPFKIGVDGNRKEVINKFRKYLLKNKELLDKIEQLRNKRLGCFCKPKDCHGDVYVEILQKSWLLE